MPTIDPKSARAEAKAAKARAKAIRPWYKRKRFIFSGIIVLVIIIIVAVSAGGKKSTSSGPAPTSGGNKNAAGCVAKPASYPDQQSTDCVALPNNTVAIANTTVTATWTRSTDSLGNNSICAAVNIKNHNSSTISYNDLYWKLQTPSGKVEDTNFTATGDLGSGDLVGGGTATGNVCFDDPGQSGTYVGIYKPDPFSRARGIWLFPLS
jgi:hypothetical protein